MEGSVRKVRKSRISTGMHGAVKRGRIHRFSKWVEKTYGLKWQTMYEKLRRRRIKRWELEGLTACMEAFGFHGSPSELWNKCKRNAFSDFMESMQMSRNTVWKRFSADDWTELELRGVRSIYRMWMQNCELKKED